MSPAASHSVADHTLATGDNPLRKESIVATTAVNRELIRVIAEEMAYGVETAVECWMTEDRPGAHRRASHHPRQAECGS